MINKLPQLAGESMAIGLLITTINELIEDTDKRLKALEEVVNKLEHPEYCGLCGKLLPHSHLV